MPISRPTLPSSKIQKKFVFVGMEEAFTYRVQAQLGLLDATPVRVLTPQEFIADTAPTNDIAVLVYQDCVAFLQNRIATGTAPSVGLHEWLEQAEIFLKALRTHRTSVFPVPLNFALEKTDLLRTALISSYDCVFSNDAPPAVPAVPVQDPTVQFFAIDTFTKSAVARRLQAELSASARAADRRPAAKVPDINTVYHALVTARNKQADLEQDLRQKNGLASVREAEASAARTDSAKLEKQIKALKTEHAVVEAALHKDVRWTRDELRSLMKQIDEVTGERVRLLGEVNQLQRELNVRDAHIEAIRVSTSWRLTGPLRWFRQLFWR